MRLGIDFGTTRIVVAHADRGNFPLVPFESADRSYDWCPSLAAIHNTGNGYEFRFGWDAWELQNEPGWIIIRSLKRHLRNAGPAARLLDGDLRLADLLNAMAASLHQQLLNWFGAQETFEVMLGVPANANSNQRFLTLDAFRRAGFLVLGMLNEPSAAAIEYAHKRRTRGRVLVYDLGGGTFDVSLVEASGGRHGVVASDGIPQLGGDDFDFALAELAIGRQEIYGLQLSEMARLLEECRRAKEALVPQTRKIAIDLDSVREGMGQVLVPVADFQARCRPLIDQTLRTTERLLRSAGVEPTGFDALYVTGGASELPLVSNMLRNEFGRKVRCSEYMRSATAIGLAIQADHSLQFQMSEIFNRNFCVWREAESGKRLILDPIFQRGLAIPQPGQPPLVVRRAYKPVHNIGHFRYLEASELQPDGQATGDIAVWDEIRFPLDPALEGAEDLSQEPVRLSLAASEQEIEEQYICDSSGLVVVKISNLTAGYAREYPLARWSAPAVQPVDQRPSPEITTEMEVRPKDSALAEPMSSEPAPPELITVEPPLVEAIATNELVEERTAADQPGLESVIADQTHASLDAALAALTNEYALPVTQADDLETQRRELALATEIFARRFSEGGAHDTVVSSATAIDFEMELAQAFESTIERTSPSKDRSLPQKPAQ